MWIIFEADYYKPEMCHLKPWIRDKWHLLDLFVCNILNVINKLIKAVKWNLIKYGYNLNNDMLWIANTLVRMTEHVTVRHTLLSHACGLSWFMFGHVFGCIWVDRTLRQLNVMWIHVYKMWIYYIKRLVDVIYLHCIYLKILRHGDLMWVKEKRTQEKTMHLQ